MQSGRVATPYQFQTRHFSQAAGFSHFGFRYYNTTVGRFITAYPLGFVNGTNVYVYCNNDPVNWIDPWGLCKEKKDWLDEPGIEQIPIWEDPVFLALLGIQAWWGPNPWIGKIAFHPGHTAGPHTYPHIQIMIRIGRHITKAFRIPWPF